MPLVSERHNASFIVLECAANSTSIMPTNIPPNLRPTLRYQWDVDEAFTEHGGRYTISGSRGNVLMLTGFLPSDDYTVYRCYAKESGSKYKTWIDKILRVPRM